MAKSVLSVAALSIAALIATQADAQSFVVPGPNGPIVVNGSSFGFNVGPNGPAFVTPNRIKRFNPWTGQIDTANNQIDHSRFDTGRDFSRFNGSRRWVNRPVRDASGNIVGYEEGYVWNNSITGREHGHLNTFTPNSSGGIHDTNRVFSHNPNANP